MYLDLLTKSTLNKLFKDGTIAGLQALYERSFKYGMENLPIDDTVLKNAVFVYILKRENVDLDNVLFLLKDLIQTWKLQLLIN